MSLNEQDALTDTAPPVISIAAAAFWQVAPLLLGKTGSRVRLGLQRSGTYLVVELERRPSTPAGALTAFMGNASQYLRIRIVQRGGNKGCEIAGAREAQDCARERVSTCVFFECLLWYQAPWAASKAKANKFDRALVAAEYPAYTAKAELGLPIMCLDNGPCHL